MEIIPFDILDLSKMRVTDYHYSQIELHENHFAYKVKYECEETNDQDEYLPWINTIVDLCIYIRKDSVIAIEKSFTEKQEKWKLYLSISGKTDDVWIYFKEENECDAMLRKLITYFYGTKD